MKLQEVIDKYKEAINKVYSQDELIDLIKKYPEIEYPLCNLIPLLNIQPERSKREDILKDDAVL